MPSGPTSSPTCLSPKPQGVPECTCCARSSTPSSTSCEAGVPGACCRTISPQLEDRSPLLQNVELDGTWERVHAALRRRLRVRMKRDPQVPTPLPFVAGRRLPRRGQGCRLDTEDPGMEGGSGGASQKACSQRGVDGLGQRVGQGGRGARLEGAPAPARVRSAA